MPPRLWHLRGDTPWPIPPGGGIIGILNTTPDSFSDGGRYTSLDQALAQAHHLAHSGAHIIDIGGESTRPGSSEISIDEELQRVIPTIRAVRAALPHQLISVDTRHAPVAQAALQAGAHIINDITGLSNPAMRAVCAASTCGIILMHMQGTPATMQHNPQYHNVTAEVRQFFETRIHQAEQAGISPRRICLDPGIGFGKTTRHNLTLIAQLEATRVRNLPILMALSRKRFLGEIFHNPALAKSSPLPTIALSLIAANHGADLHRVHDPAPLREALRHHT